jgi:hypothetical protein
VTTWARGGGAEGHGVGCGKLRGRAVGCIGREGEGPGTAGLSISSISVNCLCPKPSIEWAQLCVMKICCVALTEAAAEHLNDLMGHVTMAAQLVKGCLPSLNESRSGMVLSVHITATQEAKWPLEWDALHRELSAWKRKSVQFVSLGAGKSFQARARAQLEHSLVWQEMRHRQLGGITSARILFGWDSPDRPSKGLAPSARRNPVRPLGRFLEPSVPLTRWHKSVEDTQCWTPCDGFVAMGGRWGRQGVGAAQKQSASVAVPGLGATNLSGSERLVAK